MDHTLSAKTAKFTSLENLYEYGRLLLFNRTGLSNLLNKIQFTFEVVPCLILGLFRRFFEGVHQF